MASFISLEGFSEAAHVQSAPSPVPESGSPDSVHLSNSPQNRQRTPSPDPRFCENRLRPAAGMNADDLQ